MKFISNEGTDIQNQKLKEREANESEFMDLANLAKRTQDFALHAKENGGSFATNISTTSNGGVGGRNKDAITMNMLGSHHTSLEAEREKFLRMSSLQSAASQKNNNSDLLAGLPVSNFPSSNSTTTSSRDGQFTLNFLGKQIIKNLKQIKTNITIP